MNNIDSKFFSNIDASKRVTRLAGAYITISILRVLLYIGFKIFSEDIFFVQGGFIYVDLDMLGLSSIVSLIIYGLCTVVIILVSAILLASIFKLITEDAKELKQSRRMWVYLTVMIADILISVGFACSVILIGAFALVMIAMSAVEISTFVWLIVARRNEEE